jgi:hypothetical protein
MDNVGKFLELNMAKVGANKRIFVPSYQYFVPPQQSLFVSNKPFLLCSVLFYNLFHRNKIVWNKLIFIMFHAILISLFHHNQVDLFEKFYVYTATKLYELFFLNRVYQADIQALREKK